jgi:hypothetical protein
LFDGIAMAKHMNNVMLIIAWFLGGLAIVAMAVVGAWVLYMRSIDQPDFNIVLKDGNVEIRDYGALTVAEVTRRGDRDTAVRAGFGPLARYIFAKDRQGEKIAMTAPVTQEKAPDATTVSDPGDTTWKIHFIMPSGRDVSSLPRPANADVRLLSLEPSRRAAIRFSGRADDRLIEDNEKRLRAWLDKHGYTIAGPAVYAYYDDPLTPGIFRRNEVLLEVRR